MGLLSVMVAISCSKSDFTDNPNAVISNNLPNDSLYFDTIFTGKGSITKKIMIYNLNDQKLRFSQIKLSGGSTSSFQINMNGRSGTEFSDVELDGGDSLYLFVRANIDPTDATSPFVVLDSIQLSYNGNNKYLRLQAYGQNAYYINQSAIVSDTTWTNKQPIVLLKNLTIPEGKTLSIQKGSKIYVHGLSTLQVDGTLYANGDTAEKDRISFLTDRLDYDYKDKAGAWQGINFGAKSVSNILNNVTIKNAVNALSDTLQTTVPTANKLTLSGAVIQNNAGYGLLGRLTNWLVNNSLIANNGQAIGLYNGGSYQFNFNTIVGYSNDQVSHNYANIQFTGNQASWNVLFRNDIIYGDNNSISNELVFDNSFTWTNMSFSITNCLVKSATLPSQITNTNSKLNQDPLFQLINDEKATYDFRLQSSSPAFGSGIAITGIRYDLLGQVRNSLNPSIGCYESR